MDQTFALRQQRSELDQLLELIAWAEAGPAGYDAIHMAARALPARRPTELTLREIFDWIEATPGQPHAIGRYQFIPSTLADLVRREGTSLDERFAPDLQDRFAILLIEDANYPAFLDGTLSVTGFLDNLAMIWAGLPLANGKSAYHGTADNRATVTRPAAEAALASIFGQ
ncbi:hypothetical protein EU803_15650 [Loktanella sp. IMCC34160]|uniref:hypothetical protein n=1 Tax=Loktanella sp. IMCC34160 TaxID=2510646 RepID=UPI00101D84D4|nr:hypothetical protein [Loktanella sp. IMCC34160]RYG90048.1 hypothetical protein EU803_15650 [Loktanella sp. IMCC34160]